MRVPQEGSWLLFFAVLSGRRGIRRAIAPARPARILLELVSALRY